MSRLRLGTRGSPLARAQSMWVVDRLRASDPDAEIELVVIETYGDLHRDVALVPALGQSFFTKEIEEALLDGRADLAVHSCKDLSTAVPDGLTLAAIPEREDPRDVLLTRTGGGLASLPSGARVGTCSPRRKSFLAALRGDLVPVDLRGNVHTRLAALDDGRVDALVLAAAGLRRLGLADRIAEMLDPDAMVPAAAQGALAVETRADDPRALELVARLDHPASRAEVEAERACLRRLEAGCQAPVGAHARPSAGALSLHAAVATPEGIVRAQASDSAGRAEHLGATVAERLLDQLGIGSLRGAAWAGPAPAAVRPPRGTGATP